MKLASAEPVVWLIIAIVVAISKGLGKLKAPAQPPRAGDDDAPPPPPLQRPRRAAAAVPVRRPQERSVPPPVVRPGIDDAQRQSPPRDFRDLLAQLTKPVVRPVPMPPKVAPVPAARKAPPKAVEEPKVTPPPPPDQIARRNTQWADALRDRSNLRNIIIAAEIIGPPRGA